jgi:hypothetical protein
MARGRAGGTAAAALLAATLAWAGPAAAETETLSRGAMNLVGTPLDLALSPYTTTSTFVRKYYMKGSQSTLTKIAMTPLMGIVYGIVCTGVTGVTAALRFTDGLVNVPVGIAALGMEKPPGTQIYNPVHGENTAVVDAGPVYFGGYHCDGFFQ